MRTVQCWFFIVFLTQCKKETRTKMHPLNPQVQLLATGLTSSRHPPLQRYPLPALLPIHKRIRQLHKRISIQIHINNRIHCRRTPPTPRGHRLRKGSMTYVASLWRRFANWSFPVMNSISSTFRPSGPTQLRAGTTSLWRNGRIPCVDVVFTSQ